MRMQVTIIGGGSYQWGPTLMADLLLTPCFADGGHLVLEDIDPAPAGEDGGAGPPDDRRTSGWPRPCRPPPISAPASTAPTSWW